MAMRFRTVSVHEPKKHGTALQDDHDNMRERMNKLSVKLDDIQRTVDNNSRTVSLINKIVIAAVIAGIGSLVAQWMI